MNIVKFSQQSHTFLDYLFSGYINLGRFGVIAFFFISGYLIPISLKSGAERPILGFAIGRLFRLYPLYWLSILLALAALLVFRFETFTPLEIAANLTMAQMTMGMRNILDPYWTLFFELLFYGACVLLFLTGRLHDRTVMRVGMIVAAVACTAACLLALFVPAIGSRLPAEGFVALSYLFVMFLGHMARLGDGTPGKSAALVMALGAVVIILVAAVREKYGTGNALLSETAVIISSLLGLGLALVFVRVRSLHTRVLSYLGDISYGLYLLHPIALWIAADWLHTQPGRPYLAFTLLVFALTAAAATIAHEWLEKPAIALGKRLRERLTATSPAVASARRDQV